MVRRYLSAINWIAAFSLSGIGIAQAEPLSFTTALTLAEAQAPLLAARAAGLDAARWAAIPADALPDPKLAVGLDNFPISGPPRGSFTRDSMTMGRIGLQQDIPGAAKRQARADAATAAVAREQAQSAVARLTIRRETAVAWIERYYVEQRGPLLDALDAENRLLSAAVRAQLASQRAKAADAVVPRQEAAELADRRDVWNRDRAQATATLRRWVGDAAAAPLAGLPPPLPIDEAAMRLQVQNHPDLQAYAPMAQLAEAEVREAQAGKNPDWGVGVAYQRRSPDYGDMISLQVTVDLPVFSGSRQDPRIAAKRQEALRVSGEREAAMRAQREALDRDLAEYANLTLQLERMAGTKQALAEEKAKLQLAAYQAGTGMLSEAIAARRERAELRLGILDLETRRALLAAKLLYTYDVVTP